MNSFLCPCAGGIRWDLVWKSLENSVFILILCCSLSSVYCFH